MYILYDNHAAIEFTEYKTALYEIYVALAGCIEYHVSIMTYRRVVVVVEYIM